MRLCLPPPGRSMRLGRDGINVRAVRGLGLTGMGMARLFSNTRRPPTLIRGATLLGILLDGLAPGVHRRMFPVILSLCQSLFLSLFHLSFATLFSLFIPFSSCSSLALSTVSRSRWIVEKRSISNLQLRVHFPDSRRNFARSVRRLQTRTQRQL
ncbi:hypothetical protein BDY21DRAFT_31050 [Lineolata rhizophorae]|uniref:Uncharacterized protein n=1 Tax=Lineolata rhizophorae TaxID=578093 RepID=A0A6A6P1H5_9PEZI|nr:hypothetical protein BDY21DRAFT_31050 [Lineolata rhizophorae]